MISEEKLKQAYSKVKIVGWAMLAAVAAYIVIAELFLKGIHKETLSIYPQMRIALAFVAVSQIFAIKLIRKKIFSGKTREYHSESEGNDRGAHHRDSDGEKQVTGFLQKLTGSAILTFALCESVAVYGLVLYIIGGGRNRLDLYAFCGAATALILIHFPKLSDWQEKFDKFIYRGY